MSEKLWITFGFLAEAMFFMRFFVQWLASEIKKESTVPTAFWFFSLLGGGMLFAYATWRLDPVFMLGQGMGLLIYTRNLMLIRRKRRQEQTDSIPPLASQRGG